MTSLAVAWAVFGFTVDDALITARYAKNLHEGAGYRFNPGGPSTDGVTPLGFAHLLAPLASSTGAAHAAATWLGLLCSTIAVTLACRGALREAIATRPGRAWLALLPFAVLALGPQLAAWSVSGMETGLVTLLVTLGVTLRLDARSSTAREVGGVLSIGLAAALRPELAPAAIVLSLMGQGPASPPTTEKAGRSSHDAGLDLETRSHADATRATFRALARAGLALVPLACVTATRLAVFGAATPLSAIAKRPDVSRGVAYAAASLVLVGGVQLFSVALVRDGRGRGLTIALVAHAAAIALAGGDWMALSRLFVPVLPVLALAAARAAVRAPWPLTAARTALAAAGALVAWQGVGWNVGRVGADRAALVDAMRAPLAGARHIASVDVGWPTLAAPDATLVDLAGVTDEEVARLPGPHTQKRIPAGFIDRREVDALVFNLPCDAEVPEDWTRAPFVHGVERHLAREHGAREVFEVAYVHRARPCYVVLTRRPGAARPPLPASPF